MANLTYGQLEQVWLTAAAGTKYATTAWSELMAAIALAESGGNASSTNPNDNNGTQTSWGLWQISLGNHNEPSPNWADPVTNAKLAIQKLETQGLTAWGTYDSGAYKQFLQSGVAPSSLPSSSDTSSSSALGGLLGIPSEITGFFSDADSFINKLMWLAQPSSWVRVGSFFLAIVLLIGAVIVFTKADQHIPTPTIPIPVPV